ncbi:MAG: TRAM domain-containing protein [Ignavibacteriales bacterium]|nr:TRAM domain-containing protein [Ignavibacteriales bacterium]
MKHESHAYLKLGGDKYIGFKIFDNEEVKLNKGDVIQIKVDRYAFEGKGIGKVDIDNSSGNSEPDSFIVFVNGAYPGDIVSAKIKKLKKSYAEAIVEEVISPSPQRVQPRCKYFGTCGGCKQQDLDYSQQISLQAGTG